MSRPPAGWHSRSRPDARTRGPHARRRSTAVTTVGRRTPLRPVSAICAGRTQPALGLSQSKPSHLDSLKQSEPKNAMISRPTVDDLKPLQLQVRHQAPHASPAKPPTARSATSLTPSLGPLLRPPEANHLGSYQGRAVHGRRRVIREAGRERPRRSQQTERKESGGYRGGLNVSDAVRLSAPKRRHLLARIFRDCPSARRASRPSQPSQPGDGGTSNQGCPLRQEASTPRKANVELDHLPPCVYTLLLNLHHWEILSWMLVCTVSDACFAMRQACQHRCTMP